MRDGATGTGSGAVPAGPVRPSLSVAGTLLATQIMQPQAQAASASSPPAAVVYDATGTSSAAVFRATASAFRELAQPEAALLSTVTDRENFKLLLSAPIPLAQPECQWYY